MDLFFFFVSRASTIARACSGVRVRRDFAPPFLPSLEKYLLNSLFFIGRCYLRFAIVAIARKDSMLVTFPLRVFAHYVEIPNRVQIIFKTRLQINPITITVSELFFNVTLRQFDRFFVHVSPLSDFLMSLYHKPFTMSTGAICRGS